MQRFQNQSVAPETFKWNEAIVQYLYIILTKIKTRNDIMVQMIITSMGRNSTLQPISEFGGGGLNLIVCQLVDCRFCKNMFSISSSLNRVFTHGWFYGKLLEDYRKPHLKVIRLIFIIQMNFLLKDGEWISNEEVCYVLGQQLVNSYTQKIFSSLFTAQAFMSGFSQRNRFRPFQKNTCIEQLLVDLFVYR